MRVAKLSDPIVRKHDLHSFAKRTQRLRAISGRFLTDWHSQATRNCDHMQGQAEGLCEAAPEVIAVVSRLQVAPCAAGNLVCSACGAAMRPVPRSRSPAAQRRSASFPARPSPTPLGASRNTSAVSSGMAVQADTASS